MREGIHFLSSVPNEQRLLPIQGCPESLAHPTKGKTQKHLSSAALNMCLASYLHSLGYYCERRKRGRWLV